METNAHLQQGQKREVIFKGQLQQKIIKQSGTLLRKKKTIYEDELWVILCVHEGGTGGIPHLEWYADLQSAREHRPIKVQDLLDCQYVNVAIGEERCLVVGFVDKKRPVLELSAPSVEERRQWVTILTETLRRLNCLLTEYDEEEQDRQANCCPRSENEYVALNETITEMPHHISSSPPPAQTSPYVPILLGSSPQQQQYGQKFSLADPIPMHFSPPSTSASPLPSSRLHSHVPSSSAPINKNISSPSSTDAPVSQQSLPLPVHSPVNSPKQSPPSPQSSHPSQRYQNRVINPNGLDDHENGNFIAPDDDNDGQEQLSPPPLPPRRTPFSSQQPVPRPILPSSPIPSSPPPITTKCPTMANENYNILKTQSCQYDQLNSANPKERHNPYQQLSRLSGDFSDPQMAAAASGLCVLRLSSASTLTTSSNSNSHRSSSSNNITLDHSQNAPATNSPSSPGHSAQYDILSAQQRFNNNHTSHAERIFQESMAQPRRVFLSLSLLAENVALVELVDKVWIAGWKPRADNNLRNILHFGDEVVKMDGFTLRTVQQLPEIYANTTPGVQIELTLRSNSSAKVCTLKRPNNPKKELGIVLHKRKNKIASIERNSLADIASVPACLPPFIYDKEIQEVPAFIAEMDGIPLSLYARNEQFLHRLEQTVVDSTINLSLFPNDFCAQISRKLKQQIRNYRSFVHEN